MYARLKLLRNFLRSDGIVVISIDDNEVHNLLVICNEIFGNDSFLGLMPVINNRKGRNSGSFHSITHEYMIAYHNGEFVTRGLKMPEEKSEEFTEVSEDGGSLNGMTCEGGEIEGSIVKICSSLFTLIQTH